MFLSESTCTHMYIYIYILLIWPHFDSQITFCSCLHVSHRRSASHLQPSSSLKSSSNRSPLFKHLAFFVSRQCLRIISVFSFLLVLLLCLLLPVLSLWWSCWWWKLPSLWCALLVRLCCKTHIGTSLYVFFFLQNVHWHITVCVREDTASSSNCVSRMTTRSMPSSCFALSFW